VARVQPPGEMPGRAFGAAGGRCIRSAGGSIPAGRRAADPAGRRRWLRRLPGVCLIAAMVGWPATLASAATSPPPPTGLSAAAAGSSQISLTWTAPAKSGSQLSQYSIYEGTSPGGESLLTSSSATNGTGYTATGLTGGTTYYFEVTAVYQDQGCPDPCPAVESSRSNEASATTGSSVPGGPTGLTATAEDSSRVRLSWTAPAPAAGAPVTGYKIYDGTSPGGESLLTSSSATNGTGYTATGLTGGTTYYFEVTAVYQDQVCAVPCPAVESSRSNEASATTDRSGRGLTSQVIRFERLAPHVAGVRFTVVASASSGLQVLFGSDTPSVCSVSGSVVTTVRPGRCRITASQGGNADYAPAPGKTRSFRVERILVPLRPQSITFLRPADVATLRPVRLSASASSGLPVSFRSDTPRVCSVSGPEVTTLKLGTCTITAIQAGNARYAPAPDQTRWFQVGPVRPHAPGALVIALAAAVLTAAAGALLVHRLRSHRPAKRRVRAEPHADSPGTVRLHATRAHVTGTVRIEPHPAQVSSRLERSQP